MIKNHKNFKIFKKLDFREIMISESLREADLDFSDVFGENSRCPGKRRCSQFSQFKNRCSDGGDR